MPDQAYDDFGRWPARDPGAALVGLFGLALVCFAGCRPGPAPSPASVADPPAGSGLFEEVSTRVGLVFQHDSGSKGQFVMPEHIGSGAAWLDYDNDGLLDVYLVHCGGPGSGSKNQLFRQQPDGTFLDTSEGSGLDVDGVGMGVTVGDVNNDGRTDLFLTEYGNVHLFLNQGNGQFLDVTPAAGIDNARWATAASLIDYDRDGWLDLVVGNYVDYNPTLQCFDPAGQPDFCGPQNFQNTVSRLFRNLGPAAGPAGVGFVDTTVTSGFAKAQGKALGILCADFDGDRWPDIFVADDGIPNRLYLNQRNGTFVEEATIRGLAYNAMGSTVGNMGIALGDANNDGLFDLFIGHLSHEQHALWVQGPRGIFEDRTARHGLINLIRRGTGFGTVMADFDLDGWPDLALINGTIRRGSAHPGTPLPGLIPFWFPYAQHYQLFLNDGQGHFQDVSPANPAFCDFVAVGRGLAKADFDNDGAIDLLAICAGGPAQLFRNAARRRGHWLTVRALDPALGNRDAVGAEVIVATGERRFWRLIQPSCSYLVSNDPRAHFGLGPATRIESILVLWPDGLDERFPGGPADVHRVLRRGTGQSP